MDKGGGRIRSTCHKVGGKGRGKGKGMSQDVGTVKVQGTLEE